MKKSEIKLGVGGSLFDTINLQDPMVSFLTKKLNG
jgi:hypothetical protein